MTPFVVVDIAINESGARDRVIEAVGKKTQIRFPSKMHGRDALMADPGCLGVLTDQRDAFASAPHGVCVGFVDHRDPPNPERVIEWLRLFVAYGVTQNVVLAGAIADIAARAGLTVKRTELLAVLVSTSALDEIACRTGVSRNTAKAQLQHTMRRMRDANPDHVFTSSADLLRAIIRELADIE